MWFHAQLATKIFNGIYNWCLFDLVINPFSENLDTEIQRIIDEKDSLQPFEYAPGILVKVEPILSQIDQKVRISY